MKVLLVGNGAREHCIAEALTKSGRVKLFSFMKAKNPGIFGLSENCRLGSYTDFDSVAEYAKKCRPDFAVIGPDDPIADGMADLFLSHGIKSVAPVKTVARLESSKSFTRDLLEKYKIEGNPNFKVFRDKFGIREYLHELGGNFVVKADGLMGGKGVKVSGDHLANINEGEAYALACLEKTGKVVLEEKLIGQEFSLMSFVDGETVCDMVPVQDHKRAFEGDLGPNTGGMGSYSDSNHLLPFLDKYDIQAAHEITEKVMHALKTETGADYKGIMYGGFIAVKDGVRVIEYNARFGDPEVMNVLPIMSTDFVEVCEAILSGSLKKTEVTFEEKATVCKYLVPEGYPDNPRSNEKISIEFPSTLNPPPSTLKMYYSSVDQRDGVLYTSSSRAVAFVGIGDSLNQAEQIAEEACTRVSGPVFYRKDVGTYELIRKRVVNMRNIRSQREKKVVE